MKKISILTLITLFISSTLFSQVLEELEKRIASKNNIKTKTQTDYKYNGDKPASTGKKSIQITYDRNGDIILKQFFGAKNVVTGTEKYNYDSNGNRSLFERSGKSIYKKASQYNSQNQLLVESGFNGAENFRNIHKYIDGKLESISYTSGGKTKQKLLYSHKGNITTVKIYAGTSHTSSIKMEYDAKKNLIKETTLSINGKALEVKEYRYETNSRLIEETKTKNGNFNYRINYSYNSKGDILELAEETQTKKKYSKKVYTYDDNGNLTKYQWRRNPSEEFNEKNYSYDPKGICLKEQTYYPKSNFKLLARYEYTFY